MSSPLSNSVSWTNFVSRVWFFFRPTENQDTVQEDLVEGFIWLVGGSYLLLALVNCVILQYMEKNNMWIRREWRLLDALSKDFKTANKSMVQIKERAQQVWESVHNLRGITHKLNEIEARWVKKTAKVTSEAERCTVGFEEQVDGRNFLKKYFLFKKFITIVDLAFGMHRTKGGIEKLRKEKNYANHVVRILEESRMTVRRLQDRPIDESEHPSDPPRAPFDSKVASDLELLISNRPNLVWGMSAQIPFVVMQLHLLEAFIKDLHGLKLERAIEKVWLDEAQNIIDQTNNVIKTMLQETANKVRWLSIFKDYWGLRRKFKKNIKNVSAVLSHLLETKERYGFKFIRRESSKDANSNVPQPPMEDNTTSLISSAVRSIRSHMQDQEPNSLTLLAKELEDLEKLLKDQEATERAIGTRMASYKLLEKMASDAELCMKNSQWTEINRIHEDASFLKRCVQVYRIDMMKESSSVVGLEEDIHELVLSLKQTANTNNEAHERHSVLSIVGMRGIGKRTLAKKICHHRSIINHFPVRRLVSVQEESDEIRLLQSVGNQILQIQENENEKEYWINKLQVFLKENRCLIVLDNLLLKQTWDRLKLALIPDGSISTIMLTTRDKAVALHVNPSNIHPLRLRTREESWELFTQMVDCPPSEVEILTKRVVARTGGLPLAILRLGYLLSGKSVTEEELSVVLERVSQVHYQQPWVSTWDTNKEYLQSQPVLEKCLSYFELFPRDFEVPARRLVALWVAQGLAQNTELNEERTEETIAYGYLLELINRNIIQTVERKRNGKVSTCRFPSTLRELWLKNRRTTRTPCSWSVASFDRQLAYRFDADEDSGYSRSIHSLNSNILGEDSCPLSITVFDSRDGERLGEEVRDFLRQGIASGNFRDLQVLDLERVLIPHLPSAIGKLKHLTYLGLRWTHLETLPPSVGKLLNLQTLDLKHTNLGTLPSSVWKLNKLRNLHLSEVCRIKFMPQISAISMKNLHKLSGVFVDHESRALMEVVDKLNNLRKLRLTFQLTLEQQKRLAERIPRLTHLESLSLKSVNEDNQAHSLRLEPLIDLKKLSSLCLSGKLERRAYILSELPESLTELTLSDSGLSRGNLLLPFLGNLPQLKFLSFFSGSYQQNRMDFSGGFPNLLVLKLWCLDTLVTLKVEEGAMQKLRELEIRSCLNLTVPTGLTHLKTLQELKLTSMPAKYTADIENAFAAAKRQSPDTIIHFPAIKITNESPDAC
ncbi:Disease resistance protein RPM1 [Morus notabilis]|uniref:Disease resistance protein RPM1 n=1 Tax=Morus notabilis TaxID=981085 RepID=W9QWS4_9ROSA|nr:putative disease resistance protein At1g50180 [Morus notabilis]EXB23829.1 Disease resistance protein RPM1 [Morus notabilis]